MNQPGTFESSLRAPNLRRWTSDTYEVTSPEPREVWRELLQNDPEALPSQSPEWLDCLCTFGGYQDASRLYKFADGQQLLMPVVKRKGLPDFMSVQASFPYAWSVGGVISSCPLRIDHLSVVFADLARTPFLTMRLFPNPLQGDLWKAAQPARVNVIPRRAHVLDLEGGWKRVWQERMASGTRRKARKAERAGVEVEGDTTGRLLGVFYKLFLLSVERWAEQQHEPVWLARWRAQQRDPLRKLEYLARHLGSQFKVWVAWHDGHAVAASVVLLGTNADYALGAMDKERAGPVYANYLLHQRAIEDACRLGCRYYHMGESGESEGIAHFKERFGARAYPYSEYRLERLPLSRIDSGLRGVVKRAIGFQDVGGAASV